MLDIIKMFRRSSKVLPITLLKDRAFNPFAAIEKILVELDYMYNYDLLDENDQPCFHTGFGSDIYHQTFLDKFYDLAEPYYTEARIEQMIADTFVHPYGYK